MGNSFSRCLILFEPFINILSVTNSNGRMLRTLANVVASEKQKNRKEMQMKLYVIFDPYNELFSMGFL